MHDALIWRRREETMTIKYAQKKQRMREDVHFDERFYGCTTKSGAVVQAEMHKKV